ncbi:hypothetical protein ABDJ85_11770 [Roseateles sp. DJS-2-20]|uniref:DUF4124 domain-containing protein n=1 Tax=Roseateles paludis TaxID=3145238 RepID=A0ABV0G375_9BURK
MTPAVFSSPFLALALTFALPATALAQGVWKCEIDGQTRYTDRPCPDRGASLSPQRLQANVADAPRPPASGAAPVVTAAKPTATEPPANVCPSSTELRDMETRASSTSLSTEARQFMVDEIRRARQCAKGQGRYTEADWRISREAQAAQSSNSGAYEARLRAEGMHSAADPEEGTRIARQREQETAAQTQAARRAWREQQRQRNAPGSP